LAALPVKRVNMMLHSLREAMIYAIKVPPISELAATGGFDFRLEDRTGLILVSVFFVIIRKVFPESTQHNENKHE
jgi:hypothetical protein